MELISSSEIIKLRRDAGRYKSLHRRAVNRWEKQRQQFEEKVDRLKVDLEGQIDSLKAEIVELKKTVKTLQDLHFGKSSETSVSVAGDLATGRRRPKRNRGQQAGRRGHGRRNHTELICEEEVLELSEDALRCSICGLLAEATELESCSEEIDHEVRIIRKRRCRRQYRRTCHCKKAPGLLAAPLPLRALPQSKYSDHFWIETLLFKYEYQFPIERLIRLLDGHGLYHVAPGTLCGGIARCAELLSPLHDEIVRYDRSKQLRCMDETGLKVFVERKDRSSRVWWLWQSSTAETCVFFLDPTRSYDAPCAYLKDTPSDAVICADRYKVYQKLDQSIAYCWAHVRRDFVRIGRSERQNFSWAVRWLKRIKKLYHLNHKRVAAKGNPRKFSATHGKVVAVINEIQSECDRELASTNWWYNDSRCKVLTSLKNHWDGLMLFLTDPDIPLDNNSAERLFRPVANFRKSCFGVHSVKFGHITAMMLSIFATLKLNGIVPRSFLYEYFATVAKSNSGPSAIVSEFLPWDLPSPRKERLLSKTETWNSS